MSLGVRYMILATFSFALMNASVKYLSGFHVSQIILIRSFVSAIICLNGIKKLKLNPFGVNKKFLIIRGAFGFVALVLYFFTLHNISLASAVTLVYLAPIFTAIVGVFLLKERILPKQWIFFFMAFCGVGVLYGFDFKAEPIWLITGILSAILAAVAYVAVRKVKETDHPYVVVFYFPLIAIPFSGVWSYFEWKTPNLKEWLILIAIGLFTQVGQYYMAKALQIERAEKMVALKYIGVIYALCFGYFLFDEVPSIYALLGIILVAGGIILNIRVKHK
jgi:drug/metabolite transporter (DMT)-like permease